MESYLTDSGFTGFGEDAAWVLKGIHDKKNKIAQPKVFFWGMDSDFSKVRERRTELGRESSDAAETILKVVDELLKPDADEKDQRHALKLACIALRMPYGSKPSLINKLLELPRPISYKLSLLTVLIQAGEVIKADMVLYGIKSLLQEAANREPWLVEENTGLLSAWFQLLPFSDRPITTLDALQLLNPDQRRPCD